MILTQSHYVEKMLNRFGYSDYKSVSTPYDASLILRKNKRIMRNQLRYSQIIGSLMYLTSAARPDISFAVSKLSRFVSNSGDNHWKANALSKEHNELWNSLHRVPKGTRRV